MQVSDVQHTQSRGTRLQNSGGGSFVQVLGLCLHSAIHSVVGVAQSGSFSCIHFIAF